MPLEWEGPLAPWAAGLAEALEEQGYAERTVVRMMAVTRRLSSHLQERGVGVEELSAVVIGEFPLRPAGAGRSLGRAAQRAAVAGRLSDGTGRDAGRRAGASLVERRRAGRTVPDVSARRARRDRGHRGVVRAGGAAAVHGGTEVATSTR
jgi:hypothetical protein